LIDMPGRRRVPGIRAVLLGSIALGFLLVMGSGYWMLRNHFQQNLDDLSNEELAIYGDSLRQFMVHLMGMGLSDAELKAELERLKEGTPVIRELRLLHAPIITRQYGMHVDEEPRNSLEEKALNSGKPVMTSSPEGDPSQLTYIYPFHAETSCLACHEGVRAGEVLGAFSMVVDTSLIAEKYKHGQRDLLLMTVVESVLLLLLLYYLLDRLLLHRLEHLRAAAERMAAGDLKVRLANGHGDELGRVIDAFNRMAERLRRLMGALDQDIREQSDQLGQMVEMSRLLVTSDNLPDVLQELVRSVTESVKVTCGRILLLDTADADVLQEWAAYPVRPMAASAPSSCHLDACPLLQETLREGKPKILRRDDELTPAEKSLLLFGESQWVMCLPIVHQSRTLGVVLLSEFRSEEREPADERRLRYAETLTHELAAAIVNMRLNDQMIRQIEESVFALAEAVDKKSAWTAGHSHRVARYARAFGEAMGLSAGDLDLLYRAGLLHDIGKIGTPGTILNKEGQLLPDEYAELQRHPASGSEILSKISSFAPLIPIVRHHHEHFDGNGYPDGLAGEQIPLLARIVAVADAYDAMTSDRPYRAGMPHEEALRRLLSGAGSQFDPAIVDAVTEAKLDT